MTIESLLDEMSNILDEGKSVPFTSNLLVDAEALKTAIEDIRLNMPDELTQARKIASERRTNSEVEITRGAEAAAAEIMQQARNAANEIVEQARNTATELTEQAKNWSSEMRKSASEYVENIVAIADETLTNSVNEIRRTRQQLRAASQSKRVDE